MLEGGVKKFFVLFWLRYKDNFYWGFYRCWGNGSNSWDLMGCYSMILFKYLVLYFRLNFYIVVFFVSFSFIIIWLVVGRLDIWGGFVL